MRENELKMRDRLVELFKQAEKQQCLNAVCGDIDSLIDSPKGAEFIADYLIANGVVALPCKVGQIVWLCTSPENIRSYDFDGDGEQKEIFECVVENITFYSSGTHQVRCYCNGKFVAHYLRFSDFGKTVFLTKEEAERALKSSKSICDYTKTDWNDCCDCSAKDYCDKYNERSEIIGEMLGEVIGEIKNERR